LVIGNWELVIGNLHRSYKTELAGNSPLSHSPNPNFKSRTN
jgi:hypothetical protein